MIIRDRIFDKLDELNMTQKDFSKKTGIPESTNGGACHHEQGIASFLKELMARESIMGHMNMVTGKRILNGRKVWDGTGGCVTIGLCCEKRWVSSGYQFRYA